MSAILNALGAPNIEGLRHNTKLTAALAGVTAAVVGVIANLSIFFSIHTLFKETQAYDWRPIKITRGPLRQAESEAVVDEVGPIG